MQREMEKQYKDGDLKAWYVPQVPGPIFEFDVETPSEAIKMIRLLDSYDRFKYLNRMTNGYQIDFGLNVYQDGEWLPWIDESAEYKNFSIWAKRQHGIEI